jgi:hypothetical protein
MLKDQKALVIEYALSLSEDELRSLTLKLTEKYSGDLADAVEFMSTDKRMDSILVAAPTADAFFTTVDHVRDVLQKECKKKGLLLKLTPAAA